MAWNKHFRNLDDCEGKVGNGHLTLSMNVAFRSKLFPPEGGSIPLSLLSFAEASGGDTKENFVFE